MKAQDYLKEYQDLNNKLEKLNQIVTTRLYRLAVENPEAVLYQINNLDVKAYSLIPQPQRGKEYINALYFETRIQFIQAIEEHIANLHPHKQTKIEFPS